MKSGEFRRLALSLEGATEAPHFERTSFRVKKKIFATLHEETEVATFKFSKSDQAAFSKFGKKIVYPVPNKFGEQGWTHIDIKKAPVELITEALRTSYQEVLKVKPKKAKAVKKSGRK